MRVACVVFAFLLSICALPAAAQDDLLPESTGLIETLVADLSMSEDPIERMLIFNSYNDALVGLFEDDPLMRPVYIMIASSILDDVAIERLIDAANFTVYEPSRERSIAAVRAALIGYKTFGVPAPLKPIENYRLGEALAALADIGIGRDELVGGNELYRGDPSAADAYDNAASAFAAGEPQDNGRNLVPFVEFFGPLADQPTLIEFASDTGKARTDFSDRVIGIVRIAAQLPVEEGERTAIADVQDERAAYRRWQKRAAQQAYEEAQRRHGELGGVIDDPDDPTNDPYAYMPEQCRAINCDCSNTFDIAGEFYRTCILEEDKVMQSCVESGGRISGYCHATAYGPAAYPRAP
jgi:hypothetical protein